MCFLGDCQYYIHYKVNLIIDCLVLGQPYEGSSYAAQKDLQMAFHRIEHVRSRLCELEKKNEHFRARQQSIQRSISHTGDVHTEKFAPR